MKIVVQTIEKGKLGTTNYQLRTKERVAFNIKKFYIYLIMNDKFENIRFVMCTNLSHECEEEMFNVLTYIRDKFGISVFNELHAIKVQRIELEEYPSGENYIADERTIVINRDYFGLDAGKETKNKVIIDNFRKIFICQIGHYLFYTKNLLGGMLKVYLDNKEYLDKNYSSNYIRTLSPEDSLKEIFAQAFYDFCDGTLENKVNNKKNSLFDFIQALEVKD